MAKLAILTWRYMYLYLQNLGIFNFLKPLLTDLWSKVLPLQWPHQHYLWLAALEPCTMTKVGTPFTSYIYKPHISGTKLSIQHSHTELHQVTLTVQWSLHWTTALLHCSTSRMSTCNGFDGNSASWEYRLMSHKGFAWCSELLHNSDGDSSITLIFCSHIMLP